MTSMEDRLERSAAPWIPDPANAQKYLAGGEDREAYQQNPIIGTAVDHFTRETDFGVYDVLVLNVEGYGDVAVHCMHTVLKNEMDNARPAYGEKVGIKLTGEGEGARGKYPIYKVVVEREQSREFNWAGGPQQPRQQEQPIPERQVNEDPAPWDPDFGQSDYPPAPPPQQQAPKPTHPDGDIPY